MWNTTKNSLNGLGHPPWGVVYSWVRSIFTKTMSGSSCDKRKRNSNRFHIKRDALTKGTNPLSISTSALTAKYGSVSEDNTMGDHLAIFPDTQSGLSASAQELLLFPKLFWRGNNTPQRIGNTWAGPSSTDYGVSIASNMGYQPDAVLNFAVDGIALMKAMQGRKWSSGRNFNS